MKSLLVLVVLILCCAVAVFSQTETDLESWGLRGSVKKVESYETWFTGAENDRRQETRNISGIFNFDRTGNILESISFNNDGNGSYFERLVNYYDSDGKKNSTVKYVSGKTKPNKYFDSEPTENFYYSLMLKLKESLLNRTSYTYDKDGLIEESTINAKGDLIERKIFAHDTERKNKRFTIYNAENVIALDILTNYKNNGQIAEGIRIENGVEVVKFILYFDERNRIVKDEQFVLKPSINSPSIKEFVLDNRAIKKFNDHSAEMKWMFFDAIGTPISKLIIIDKNDDEISRDRFEYKLPSADDANSDSKIEWRFADREFQKYEYDKQGNWVKCTCFKQESLARPPYISSIYERNISYY